VACATENAWPERPAGSQANPLKNPAQSDRILFVTGDLVNERTCEFPEEQHRNCLAKPFTFDESRSAPGKAATTDGTCAKI
jgi:hypothetical protein